MSRLIDADKLLNIADETALAWEYRRIVSDIRNIIEKAPTIDPESLRPRGRWEILTDDFDCEYMRCTCCKEEFYPVDEDTVDSTPKFCPNCGAKMEDGDG